MIFLTKFLELLASHSTAVSASSRAYPTVGDLVSRVAADMPSTQSEAWHVAKVSDFLAQHWQRMASTCLYTTTLSSGQAIYPFTTDMAFENIRQVLVSDSSALSTTAVWTRYDPAGMEDALTPRRYFKAGHGLGLYPVPTSDEHGNYFAILYSPIPPRFASTSDSTTVLPLPYEYLAACASYVKAEIAGSGDAPDVALRNNHWLDMQERLARARMDDYRRRTRNIPRRYSYRSGW